MTRESKLLHPPDTQKRRPQNENRRKGTKKRKQRKSMCTVVETLSLTRRWSPAWVDRRSW